jgi:hypothetical protein
MCQGHLENTITDLDFLESLAAKRCFLVPPWVMLATPRGGLVKITRVTYTLDGQLDKPAILVAMARKLREIRALHQTHRRFHP